LVGVPLVGATMDDIIGLHGARSGLTQAEQ